MHKIAFVLAHLACSSHAQHAQPSAKLGDTDKGSQLNGLTALVTFLLASNPAAAFSPGAHSPLSNSACRALCPALLHRLLSRHFKIVLQEDRPERRMDDDGGVHTLKEFQDFYGEAWEEKWSSAQPSDRIPISNLTIDQLVEGSVVGIVPSLGAFLDIGADFNALLQIKDLKPPGVNLNESARHEIIEGAPQIIEDLTEGDIIKCFVNNVDLQQRRIWVTFHKSEANWCDLQIGEEVEATVMGSDEFGLRMNVGGYQARLQIEAVNGSDIPEGSDSPVQLKKGDTVKCTILEITKRWSRGALGIKLGLAEREERGAVVKDIDEQNGETEPPGTASDWIEEREETSPAETPGTLPYTFKTPPD